MSRKRAIYPASDLGTLYLALGAFVMIGAVASVRFAAHPLIDTFGAEVTTDALGILVTVAVVHRLLERQERSRRLRGSVGTLRAARSGLQEMANGWADLIKGSMIGVPDDPATSFQELFAAPKTDSLLRCDFGAPTGAAPGGDGWPGRSVRRVLSGRRAVRDVLVHRASLDPVYVEALEAVADDQFLDLAARIVESPDRGGRESRILLNSARSLRLRQFEGLLSAIALHNELAREAGRIRSRSTAPRADMLGIELDLDHDLRVACRISPAWWTVEPRPGTCRHPGA